MNPLPAPALMAPAYTTFPATNGGSVGIPFRSHFRGHELASRVAATPAPAGVTTMVDLLRMRAEDSPHARAFSYAIDGEQRTQHMTYAELDARARGIAFRLQQAGLSGARALLLYPSGLDFIAAFFGCLYAGVVAVPAYPPRRNRNADRIEAVVRDAQASVVLSTSHALVRTDRVVAADAALRELPWWATDEPTGAAADQWRSPGIDSSSLAFLQYTSGSTGDPKGVMLSHRNILQNLAVIRAGFETTPSDIAVFWLPLYHDMGLIGGILEPLYAGIWCTLMSPAHFLQQPIRWLRMISATRATISGGPNFAYDLCLERVSDEAKRGLDLSSWSVAFNGAEPIRAETLDRFAEKFADCGFRREAFYPCYGLAESTLLVSGGGRRARVRTCNVDATRLQQGQAVAVPDMAGVATATLVECGRPLLDQDVRIVDPEHGTECPAGTVGEIWVAGASVATGYWQRPDASRDIFAARLPGAEQPFLRTGDLGFVARSDEGGGLYVTGRRKDLIIIRGVNHYPHDIELTARRTDEELASGRAAAFAVPGDGGEQLVVVLEVPRRQAERAAELRAAIRRQVLLTHDVAPADVVLVEANSIPKTSSGKLQRYACRQAYLEGTLAEVSPRRRGKSLAARAGSGAAGAPTPGRAELNGRDRTAPSARVAAAVYDAIRSVAKDRARHMRDDSNLIALGLDSLERMEIVAAVEERFGGRFAEDAVLDMETPADVVRAVEKHLLAGPDCEDEARKHRAIERGDYDFAESLEYLQLQKTLRLTEQVGLANPYFTAHEGVTGDRTVIDGREMVNFCSYNYLGMSGDPVVTAAAQAAVERYGTSVSASRLVSGEKPLHRELESAIAEFLGAEAAITMVGGHATNETTIGHLFGPGDLILHDALAHNSIVQGCKLSGARRRAFPHNDPLACRELLELYRREHRRVLIVVEGVYSMDGDIATLPEFVTLKEQYQAYLMVDEAHSLGTIGPGGRGIAAHFGLDPRRVDLWMGTMSKALGSCGGYIAARREIIEYLKYTAPGFVYSVGMPPASAAAALAALEQIEAHPERVDRLQENAALFLALTNEAGLNTGPSRGTPIVPLITGSSVSALRLSDWLFQDGINVQPILHPAVEEDAARLRFFLTSDHTEQQIRQAVELAARHWHRLAASNSAA